MATDLTTLPLRNLKNMHKHAKQQLGHWTTETTDALSALLLAKENKEHWEAEIALQEAELVSRGEFEADDDVDEDAEGDLVHVDLLTPKALTSIASEDASDNPPY